MNLKFSCFHSNLSNLCVYQKKSHTFKNSPYVKLFTTYWATICFLLWPRPIHICQVYFNDHKSMTFNFVEMYIQQKSNLRIKIYFKNTKKKYYWMNSRGKKFWGRDSVSKNSITWLKQEHLVSKRNEKEHKLLDVWKGVQKSKI